MRPRPEGRGELRLTKERFDALTSGLQCGHDPKAVENITSRLLYPPHTRELQCGHDPKAVENRGRGSSRPRPAPWLQCGHDPKAVENVNPGAFNCAQC